MCFAPQHRALFPHLDFKVAGDPRFFNTFDLRMCFAPQRRALFPHLDFNGVHFFNSSTSKSAPDLRCFIRIFLTWKCASRHGAVHFFNISTSKHAPKLLCFSQVGSWIWFAPQRRALFRHLNFQKMLWQCCVFSILTTTASNFSSLSWPDGSAPAALVSLLFDLPELQIIGNTQSFAAFLPFGAPAASFFWLFLLTLSLLFLFSSLSLLWSSLIFSDSLWSFFFFLFYSLLFSDSSHLCFSIGPWYCRKFNFETSFDNMVSIHLVTCKSATRLIPSLWPTVVRICATA